jgi:hypothetical protein
MTTLRINPDDFTIGDLEDFESITGTTFEKALAAKVQFDEDGNKVVDAKGRPVKAVEMNTTVLKALIYLSERATNPDFTIDDARKVKVSELQFGSETEPDPTEQTV